MLTAESSAETGLLELDVVLCLRGFHGALAARRNCLPVACWLFLCFGDMEAIDLLFTMLKLQLKGRLNAEKFKNLLASSCHSDFGEIDGGFSFCLFYMIATSQWN